MKSKFDEGVEDVCEALRTGRKVREHGPYGVMVGDAALSFRPMVVHVPEPTGRQLLEAAHVHPLVEHLVFQVLADGMLKELRQDETTDLRKAGVESFVVFRSDRSFRFELDGRVYEWGAGSISGTVLKTLARVDTAATAVCKVSAAGAGQQIEDDEVVDLTLAGVEQFKTAPLVITIIVNGRPTQVHKRELNFMEIVRIYDPNATINDRTAYTITYKRGPAANPEGSLVDGQSAKLKNGMVFNVTATDKS